MPRPDRSNALDHIVVIMFENRSFDHLLGRADAIALIDEVLGHMFPGRHAC